MPRLTLHVQVGLGLHLLPAVGDTADNGASASPDDSVGFSDTFSAIIRQLLLFRTDASTSSDRSVSVVAHLNVVLVPGLCTGCRGHRSVTTGHG